MENNYFLYKTHIGFSIVSNEVDPDIISKELNITPDRYYKKGDKSISKHSGSVIIKTHNLWSIESKPTIIKDETISHHVEYLKFILLPKVDVLTRYKNNSFLELSFWIWIETDNAGIGLDLNEAELGFLNSISNRIHFSLICHNENEITF